MSAPLAERLRPQSLEDYIGQQHLVGEGGVFRRFIEAGNVPSFILWGPPGVGKTTLAKIVANALERPFYTLSAVTSGVKEVRDVIESAKSQKFFSAKTPLLFIDEIHRFNKSQQDSLLGAVEQGIITLIGATTKAGMLSSPLRDRFGVICRLENYTTEELTKIVENAAKMLSTEIEHLAAEEVAKRSRGTPRIANRLLRRVRDYAIVKGHDSILLSDAKSALKMLEIDELGLDAIDNKILKAMAEKFNGLPCGLDTLAATINEDANTIEDVYEPYLLQLGFVARTPRGRILLKRGYEHIGLTMPENRIEQASLFDNNNENK